MAEADSLPRHLLGQPVVAVDVDLHGVREPGLEPHVHQAEVRIDAVVVEDALRTIGEDQFGPPNGMAEFDRATGFLAAEDGHQPLGDRLAADDVLDKALFAELPLAVLVGPACRLGQPLGMVNQLVGELFEHRDEILTADAQYTVDKRVQMSVAAKGKVPLKDDSIKTRQRPYNEVGELLDEVAHGVLLSMAWCNNHHQGRTPFFLFASVPPRTETEIRSRYGKQSLTIFTTDRRLRRRPLFGCGRRPR